MNYPYTLLYPDGEDDLECNKYIYVAKTVIILCLIIILIIALI